MDLNCLKEVHAVGGPGNFYLGRTEDLLDRLISEYHEKVRLIYLDPPFRTGETFSIRLGRGKNAPIVKIFDDKLSDSEYIEWMTSILSACHQMLDNKGSIYVHLDYRMSAKIRIVLDSIFGEDNFMNEIIWTYKSGGRSKKYYPRKHDTILFYRKTKNAYFNINAVGIPRGSARRNHMKRFIDENGKICYSIRSNGKVYKYSEDSLVYPTDVWSDIEHLQQKDRERCGYPTQKPESLLRRIIGASSKENDLVMDLFSGSGTTAAVANKMGRTYVAVDQSPIALSLIRKRLLANTGEINLLENKSSEMIFHYSGESYTADLEYQFIQKGGKDQIQLLSASLPEESSSIIYAAIGYLNQDTFFALSTNCSPKFPLTLPLPSVEHPYVNLVDSIGNRYFTEIK